MTHNIQARVQIYNSLYSQMWQIAGILCWLPISGLAVYLSTSAYVRVKASKE